MHVAAETVEVVDRAFEDRAVVLPAFEAGAQGLAGPFCRSGSVSL